MADLLTAAQVQERFGFARSSLLRWEEEGKIIPAKTPGGQRRYDTRQIERVLQRESYSEPASEAPPYHEMGVTGLDKWGGSLYEESLSELRGLKGRKLLREMRVNDPVIAAVFFAIEGCLKQASWRVKPCSEREADKQCAKFIESCIGDMSFTWSDTMDFILQMLEQGFTVLEVVYKKRLGPNGDPTSKYYDGRIGWRKWAPRPAESLEDGNEWVFDASGGIKGCNQIDDETGKTVFLPIERILLFRTTAVPSNTPEGAPIHRPSYLAYYYTRNLQEIEGIGVERDLGGVPVVYLGNDCTTTGTNSDFALSVDLVRNVRVDEQVGIVVPHAKMGQGAAEGQGMLVELLASNSSRQHDVGGIIERYDKRKAMSVLAQFIMLGMDRTGSFALAQTQSDLFVLAINSWLQKIADVINRIAIPRLMRYNYFPNITGLPEVVPSSVAIPNLEQVSWYINSLVGRGVITPDAELERHLRQIARLPEPMENATPQETGPKRDVRDTALILRRVILALREMPTSGMSDEQLEAMIKPLVDEMKAAIEQETGVSIATPEAGATGGKPAGGNRGSGYYGGEYNYSYREPQNISNATPSLRR